MWGLTETLNFIYGRLLRGKDAVILITGEEGEGKSLFALWFGSQVDPRFDHQNQDHVIYFDIKRFFGAVNRAKGCKVIVVDEAIDVMDNRRATSVLGRLFRTYAAKFRFKNKIQMYIIPHIGAFDPYVRNHRGAMWIHIARRYVAQVHLPSRSKFSYREEPYWREVGGFQYPPMDKDILMDYKAIKGTAWRTYLEGEFAKDWKKAFDEPFDIGAFLGETEEASA